MALLRSLRAGAVLAACWLGVGLTPAAGLEPGEPMPTFTARAWSGEEVVVDAAAARVLIVDIWASWCRPCREALPALAALRREHDDARLRVMAVSIDRERDLAERFLDLYLPERGVALYHDPDASVPAVLGAPGMPTTVLAIDGVVRSVDVGFSSSAWSALERRVRAALRERPVTDSRPTPH